MAVDLTKLIDFDLLKRYDTKLKDWVRKRIVESNEIVFTTNNSLPATGNMNLLYITEDSIFLWDGSEYIKVGGQGTGTTFIPSIDSNGDLTWTNDGGLTNPNPVNVRGPAGKNGKDGQDGADGKSAYDIAVKNGFTGDETAWLESLKGADGANGNDGSNGKDGDKGEDGKSAYDIAIENGFTGSEADWLESLKGKDGTNGASFTIKGMFATKEDLLAAHPIGEAGDAYAVGDSNYNEIYNWSVDKQEWENLGSLEGPPGPKGEDSTVPGPAGTDGVSPTVKIEDTDNGVNITITDANGDHKFSLVNGINGVDGNDGQDGQSAYDLAAAAGFEGDEAEWLASLKGADGADGKSAYEIAVDAGFEGDESQWLESLKQDAIESLAENEDSYIVAMMGDGTEINTNILAGSKNVIVSITIDEDNNLKATYRDGTEKTIGSLSNVAQITDIQLNEDNKLVFTMSDGFTVTTEKAIEGKQGKDGSNVVSMRLDEDRHLISTLSNGIEIDAGVVDIEGLTLEETRVIDVKLMTASITFDGVTTQFALPVTSETLMVYVNGLCLEENIDYTIDENGTITFNEVFKTTDRCTLRWLDENAADNSDNWATKEDIDKLFSGNSGDIEEGNSLWATPGDIDNMFS